MSPELSKNGITFPLSESKRAIEWRNINVANLNHYLNQINTKIYNEYKISDQCFQDDGTYKRESDIRVTCERIVQRQHLTMKKC